MHRQFGAKCAVLGNSAIPFKKTQPDQTVEDNPPNVLVPFMHISRIFAAKINRLLAAGLAEFESEAGIDKSAGYGFTVLFAYALLASDAVPACRDRFFHLRD